eukprot:EC723228.1.p1 GENE.EC723228.1~~EC723228.1.p1  ORF type:complete len:187 (+),score=41.88 EC723228.1:50-562(+)
MSQLEELPKAIITRIIRNKLPENVNVAKDAKAAISQAASVFILYATATAHDFAKHNSRTTVTAKDVIDAMKELEFDDFVPQLEEALESYKKEAAGKRKKVVKKTAGEGAAKDGEGAGDEKTGEKRTAAAAAAGDGSDAEADGSDDEAAAAADDTASAKRTKKSSDDEKSD